MAIDTGLIIFFAVVGGAVLALIIVYVFCLAAAKKKEKKTATAEDDSSSSDSSDDESMTLFDFTGMKQKLLKSRLPESRYFEPGSTRSSKHSLPGAVTYHHEIDLEEIPGDTDRAEDVSYLPHTEETEDKKSVKESREPVAHTEHEPAPEVAAAVMEDASTTIDLTLHYNSSKSNLYVVVHQAQNLPLDKSGTTTFVKFVLLPPKVKHHTKSKAGPNPKYQEKCKFKVPQAELHKCELLIEVNSGDTKHPKTIAQCTEPLTSIAEDIDVDKTLKLQTIRDVEKAASTGSQEELGAEQTKPRIEVSLQYNSSHGKLTVVIIRGEAFSVRGKGSEIYLKVNTVAINEQVMEKRKTGLKKFVTEPEFNESITFNLPRFNLPNVSLVIKLYSKRTMGPAQQRGCISLGHSNTSREAEKLWENMKAAKGDPVKAWLPVEKI